MSRKLALTNNDIFLAVTPITFDIAALELFLPLSVGARVILLSGEDTRDGQRLIERLGNQGQRSCKPLRQLGVCSFKPAGKEIKT